MPFKKLYDQIASDKHEADNFGPYTGGNGRIDRAVDLILNEDFPRSGGLLDVGGATGNLGYTLRNNFNYRTVVEIAEDCRKPAEAKGNNFLCTNVDLHGFHNGMTGDDEDGIDAETIDLVVALDFIEHIIDPHNFASECMRVLKPGGRVLINTPNIQFWRHLHSLVVDGRFPHTSGDRQVFHGGHVAFFNLQDMREIFSRFTDHRMHTRGLKADPPPPIWSSICVLQDKNIQLSYADLIFSCKKP